MASVNSTASATVAAERNSAKWRLPGEVRTVRPCVWYIERAPTLLYCCRRVQLNLQKAIDFASNCSRAYLLASPSVRRDYNQALFKRIFIDADGVRVQLAEPFNTLLGGDMMSVIGRGGNKNTEASDISRGSTTADAAHGGSVDKWGAAYLQRIRSQQKPAPKTVFEKTIRRSPSVACVAGVRENPLVPPAGLEPATPATGRPCSIL